jgi:tetratricopeptide (TPR) repeat protein
LAVASRTHQALATQPWDDQLNRQAVEKAMARLDQPRFARFRDRRIFRIELVFAGLVLLAGVAAAALWRHQPSAKTTMPTPAADKASRIAFAPSLPTEPLAPTGEKSPDLPASEPALQRSAHAQPSAATLFAQALALRAEGKINAAIALHRRLQRLYPDARETRLSFALTGRLLLDRGAPEQALSEFNQYLARPGEVAEEALVGRATALGVLGRSAAEAAAWQQVLDRHPDSVYANRAKERLAVLHKKSPPETR